MPEGTRRAAGWLGSAGDRDLPGRHPRGVGPCPVRPEAFALADVAARRPGAFLAAGKRSRVLWLLLLAGAAVAGFLVTPRPVGLELMPMDGGTAAQFGLPVLIQHGAIVPALIYLANVRPQLRG